MLRLRSSAVCQGERTFALRFSLVCPPSGVELLWIPHAVLELAIALKGRNSDALQTSYLGEDLSRFEVVCFVFF